jgi:hypothetical protein
MLNNKFNNITVNQNSKAKVRNVRSSKPKLPSA